MKQIQKLIGILLTLCIILSSLAISLTAYATGDEIAKAENAIIALSENKTNIASAVPTDPGKLEAYNQKLSLYNDALKAYKALSVEQKDSFDIQLTLNLLKAFTEREAFVIKNEYDSNLPEGSPKSDQMTALESRQRAMALLDEKLSEHPSRTQAIELAKKHLVVKHACSDGKTLSISASVNFTKYPDLIGFAKDYINEYVEAPSLVRKLLDGYNASFDSFSSNTIGAAFTDIIKMSGNIDLAENPFQGGSKPTITHTKPKAKNYADGENDSEYIAALELYLVDKKAVVEYDRAEKLYLYNFYIEAIKKYKDIISEAETACSIALMLFDGYLDFHNNSSTEKAKSAMRAYDEMTSEYDKSLYKKLGSVYCYYLVSLNSKGDDYSGSGVMISQLYSKCAETAGIDMIAEFEQWIVSIDPDKVTNEIIASAEEKYNSIPKSLINKISEDAIAKYELVLSLYSPIQPITASDYNFEKELSEFSPVKSASALPVIGKIFELPIAFENAVAGLIYRKAVGTLMTNKNVSVVGTLYKFLVDSDITAGVVNISNFLSNKLKPSDMAKYLIEEKYAGARAKLLFAAETDDTVNAFENIVFENGDWGFEDGDANGFACAVAAALRPATDIIHNGIPILDNIIYLPNYYSEKGDYIYGAYEELIPVLEGIGLKGVVSSQEYTLRFEEAKNGEIYDYLDSLILPVLLPVAQLINDFESNIVYTVFDILPNVARIIDGNILNSQLALFLKKSDILSGVKVDLSGEKLEKTIPELSVSVPIGKLNLKIGFGSIDLGTIARCGKLRTLESNSAAYTLRLDVEANRASVQENIIKMIKISLGK